VQTFVNLCHINFCHIKPLWIAAHAELDRREGTGGRACRQELATHRTNPLLLAAEGASREGDQEIRRSQNLGRRAAFAANMGPLRISCKPAPA